MFHAEILFNAQARLCTEECTRIRQSCCQTTPQVLANSKARDKQQEQRFGFEHAVVLILAQW